MPNPNSSGWFNSAYDNDSTGANNGIFSIEDTCIYYTYANVTESWEIFNSDFDDIEDNPSPKKLSLAERYKYKRNKKIGLVKFLERIKSNGRI